MKVVILSALGNKYARNCISSLLETCPRKDFDLFLIRERGFREMTLNYSLDVVGRETDILFVGEDIQFTPGWYQALKRHFPSADILGLSMLYPHSSIVQDRGYDLVSIDGEVILEPRDRGSSKEGVAHFGFRYCHALSGCFFLVKAPVLQMVSRFREEGQNRWGEFIFMTEARQSGASVGVVDHYLFHRGESTKSNPVPELRSTSYQLEKGFWREIVEQYVDAKEVQIRRERVLDDSFLKQLMNKDERVLIFGIGTVAELFVRVLGNAFGRMDFCVSLPEEVGRNFFGKTVIDVSKVDMAQYDMIIVTPLFSGEKIIRKVIFPLLPSDFSGKVGFIKIMDQGPRRIHLFVPYRD